MKRSIRCIVIDDEQLAIDSLLWQLNEFTQGLEVVSTFTNPREAQVYLSTHSIDLCFLDVDMPEMSGFDFLSKWAGSPPFDIIFTTAYSEYAVRAFKVSAIDYLLKPIDEEDLAATIAKYQQGKSPAIADQLALMMEQLQSPATSPGRIALPTAEGIHMVSMDDILHLEADNNYTTVYLSGGRTIMLSRTLKDMDSLLDARHFFRIHQSHTIHLAQVKLYQRGRGGSVTLLDGTVLPVSKTRKEAFLKVLGV